MKAKNLVQIPIQHIRANQLADGSWKYHVYAPELLPEQVAAMSSVASQPGWMLIKPNEIKPEDVPEVDAPMDSDAPKTKSQRLRGALFVLWEKTAHKKYPDFENYYNVILEGLIESVKGKIPQ